MADKPLTSSGKASWKPLQTFRRNLAALFRLYVLYGKMDLVWFLRDTRYCLIYMASDLICSLSSICGIFLLSENFGGFGGMGRDEVLFMLSYATIVNGIHMIFFMGNNTSMVSRIIGRGQLDHAVIQPVPVWIQLLTQGFLPVSSNFTLFCGIGMMIYSIRQLPVPIAVTPLWCLLLVVNVLSSCLIIMAIIYLISCLAFYAPAAAEEIAQSGRDLFSINTYPLGALGKRARNLFCLFIPVGLTAWLPSQGLLSLGRRLAGSVASNGSLAASSASNGSLAASSVNSSAAASGNLPFSRLITDNAALLAAPLMALCLVLITALLFKKGMKYYATNGSPRYSGFGHR